MHCDPCRNSTYIWRCTYDTLRQWSTYLGARVGMGWRGIATHYYLPRASLNSVEAITKKWDEEEN
eukprot:scaffold59449_cov17-Prasinocladus_malaysianus.AAC.2